MGSASLSRVAQAALSRCPVPRPRPGAAQVSPTSAATVVRFRRAPRAARLPRRGAATGEGLGNAFLSHISAVDGIYHVCRAFEDADVIHVEDRIDPVGDLDIIAAELRSKDIERLNSEHTGGGGRGALGGVTAETLNPEPRACWPEVQGHRAPQQ